jgi:hypothetical protein
MHAKAFVLDSAVSDSDSLIPQSGEVKAEGHLAKPIDIDSLLKMVSNYCQPPSA